MASQPNGHAKRGQRKMSVTEAFEKLDESFYKQENIFLFIPNIIGESVIPCRQYRV